MGLRDILSYPIGVYFILANEFCERFSFYGMRTLLTVYLVTEHHLQEHVAVSLYHAFIMISYFAPLVGSVLADSYFGKARVILYVSIIYVFGHVMLSVGAIPNLTNVIKSFMDYAGLLVIALGTGGIKPCVSAFAADQFDNNDVEKRSQFFSFFYFAINAGSLFAYIITPYVKDYVKCFGSDTCYPLAFGIPGVLMFIAFVIFSAGWRKYKKEPPSGENVATMVVKCMALAFARTVSCQPNDSLDPASGSAKEESRSEAGKSIDDNQFSGFSHPKTSSSRKSSMSTTRVAASPITAHYDNRHKWLNRAAPNMNKKEINAVKSFVAVVIMFLPMIVFWALFDQQGSTWLLQGYKMDGQVGSISILPESLNILNPLLIVTLVPVFEGVLYPLAKKFVHVTPLRKMALGGMIAALSFGAAGFVQLRVEATLEPYPTAGHSYFQMLATTDELKMTDVDREEFTVPLNQRKEYPFGKYSLPNGAHFELSENKQGYVAGGIGRDGEDLNVIPYPLDKDKTAKTKAIFLVDGGNATDLKAFVLGRNDDLLHTEIVKNGQAFEIKNSFILASEFKIYIGKDCSGSSCPIKVIIPAQMGATFVIYLPEGTSKAAVHRVVMPNSVNILWQIPQQVLITIGEILLSVTGLEFAYTQADPTMKSVLQAMWLMTVALGNLFAMVIEGGNFFETASTSFFFFGVAMAVVMLIFIALAHFYHYVDRSVDSEADEDVGDRSEKPLVSSSQRPLSSYEDNASATHAKAFDEFYTTEDTSP